MNYKSRPKINSKIIFNNISDSIKSALVIGVNNSDIIEILKLKNIAFDELNTIDELELLNFLSYCEDNKYEVIILNLELCNFYRIKKIIETVTNKGFYIFIRFRNNTHKDKVTKKKKINNIIKINKINIVKKIYGRRNFISESVIFKYFAYYTIYIITKNKLSLNFDFSFIDKLKKFFLQKDKIINNVICNMENKKYGK